MPGAAEGYRTSEDISDLRHHVPKTPCSSQLSQKLTLHTLGTMLVTEANKRTCLEDLSEGLPGGTERPWDVHRGAVGDRREPRL